MCPWSTLAHPVTYNICLNRLFIRLLRLSHWFNEQWGLVYIYSIIVHPRHAPIQFGYNTIQKIINTSKPIMAQALSRAACLTVITVIVIGTYSVWSDQWHTQAIILNVDRRFDRYRTLQRRLLNCIIIGQMKCGTTALLRYLDHHPDIVSAHYEFGFFNTNYGKGLEWYRNQMPLSSPGQLTVERTPSYCMSNISAPRILAMNASVKAILLVRDPIVRSVSHWIHSCHGRLKTDRDEDKRKCAT